MGIPSIVEIPTWHRDFAERVAPRTEPRPSKQRTPLGRWKNELVLRSGRSIEEYDLATLLLVLSEKAGDTFRESGIAKEKLSYLAIFSDSNQNDDLDCYLDRCLRGTIYEEVLAGLTVPSLHYYGFLDDPDGEYCWLFVEEATGAAYSRLVAADRAQAARWLGLLHRVRLRRRTPLSPCRWNPL